MTKSGSTIMQSNRPLVEVFYDSARKSGTPTALQYCDKVTGEWRKITWDDYAGRVSKLAGWLKAQGIGRGDRVAILSANRPEWLITDLAILAVGAVSVPIFATSSQKDITYILEHSESKALFCDELTRCQFLAKEAPKLLVLYDPPTAATGTLKTVNLKDILAGDAKPISSPETMGSEETATIIYTSGTTGLPKGVIHTHGNIIATLGPVLDVLNEGKSGPDLFFSFLPLSHVAERVLVEFGSVVSASEVAFARSVDTLAEDLVRFRPTILLCVPRLWERIYEKIQKGLVTASPAKKAIFALARRLGSGRINGDRILKTGDNALGARIGDALVGRKLRTKLGMDRVRLYLTGSAPTRAEVLKFFASFGIFIREVYGLTENLCLGFYTGPDQIVIGSCGKAFKGNETRIAADGEILFRAPWNFKGYYKNPEATAEVLSADGWFATGDLGRIDAEGRLAITGRKKELLKTSTGKYVAPVPIEDQLKALPVISDAMIVGDNEKYCVALIAVDLANAPAGGRSLEELLKEHLTRINAVLAHHESIKRLGILKSGFSIEAGTLTPSMKLKRKVAMNAYKDFIAKVYQATDMIVRE